MVSFLEMTALCNYTQSISHVRTPTKKKTALIKDFENEYIVKASAEKNTMWLVCTRATQLTTVNCN